MAQVSFAAGDVVRLKSGGLQMTISKISDRGISCQWFDEKSVLQTGFFPPETLKKVEGF